MWLSKKAVNLLTAFLLGGLEEVVTFSLSSVLLGLVEMEVKYVNSD